MSKIVLLALCLFPSMVLATSLVIIDTEGKNRYQYRNLELLCRSVGFKTDYKNIYDLLESPILNYDAALFLCSSPIIIMQENGISTFCLNAVKQFIAQGNKTIGFILPNTPRYAKQIETKTLDIVAALDLLSNNKTLTAITQPFIQHFLQSDMRYAHLYGTTLFNRAVQPINMQTFVHRMHKAIHKNQLLALTTPSSTCNLSTIAQKTFPLGLLLHDQQKQNIIFFSRLAALSAAELDENYFKNPLELNKRQEQLHATQQTLADLFQATCRHKLNNISPISSTLPKQLTLEYMLEQKEEARNNRHLDKRYAWAQHGIKCAWLDPNDFFYNNDQTLLDKGVKMLFDASFNLLWFELLPEWYLSDHGRKKDERETYIKQTTQLFTAITAYAKKHNKHIPQLFLGLNLSSNFYNHPVKHPVIDLFGRIYDKIPCPIDVAYFWQPEVLEVFDTFIETFKDVVSIDGVFLDFEMYHAQKQTGAFTDLMDFSDFSWHQYTKRNTYAPKQATHSDKINYLKKNRLFDDYFNTLTNYANEVGQLIKTHMRQKLPNLLFAAYAPTLPNAWFYRGITRGLSSKQEPLFYATFNTDFYSHYCWLTSQRIYLLHASVAMLSKLSSPQSFKLVDTINTYHDFIWYNRPSRMIPNINPRERRKMWWASEVSPLPIDQFTQLVIQR